MTGARRARRRRRGNAAADGPARPNLSPIADGVRARPRTSPRRPRSLTTMSALASLPLLWSQVFLPGVPERLRGLIAWMLLLGEPSFTTHGLVGGLITWVKILSLFC